MKIMAIGDPHGEIRKIKKISLKNIDLILLTGDLGSSNLMRKMAFENVEREKIGLPKKEYSKKQRKSAFMEAYNSSMEIVKYLSRFAPVYIIYGNVESSNRETRNLSNEIGLKLPLLTNNLNAINNVKVINNRKIKFKEVKIGGLGFFTDTNWIKDFKPKDYRKRMKNARKDTDKAKKVLKWFGEVDILLHHQPPYGTLDKVTAKFAPGHWKGKNAGSKVILDYIKKNHPRYSFCGHIHEGKGMKKIGRTIVYNLGVCHYKIIDL